MNENTLDLDAPLAFDVPVHDRMAVRVAGKVPNTVVTLEAMVFTWRICEYTEPLSYCRHWCYPDLMSASIALAAWMVGDDLEPARWVKATDKADGHYRVRRGRVGANGERIETEDMPE